MKIRQPYCSTLIRIVHLFCEIRLRPCVQRKHRLSVRLRLLLLWCQLLLYNFNMIFLCQIFQCPRVVQLLVFHDKMHRTASLSTTKTLKNTLGWRNSKRTCLFIMERTQTYIIHPTLTQRHKIAHYINDLRRIQYLIYRLFVNHIFSFFKDDKITNKY